VQRAIRDDRWKLILYPEVDRVQLFDLQVDPFETTNLAGLQEHAGRVASMKALLKAQQVHFGDTGKGREAVPR
jgi:arylsulfatase A-like enzyme